MDDSIYLIVEGKCNILMSIKTETCANAFPDEIKERFDYVVLDHFRKGEYFGEHSVINGEKNPYTVQVKSDRAIIYKIHRNSLQCLGDHHGGVIGYFRGQMRMRTNWMRFKT